MYSEWIKQGKESREKLINYLINRTEATILERCIEEKTIPDFEVDHAAKAILSQLTGKYPEHNSYEHELYQRVRDGIHDFINRAQRTDGYILRLRYIELSIQIFQFEDETGLDLKSLLMIGLNL